MNLGNEFDRFTVAKVSVNTAILHTTTKFESTAPEVFHGHVRYATELCCSNYRNTQQKLVSCLKPSLVELWFSLLLQLSVMTVVVFLRLSLNNFPSFSYFF